MRKLPMFQRTCVVRVLGTLNLETFQGGGKLMLLGGGMWKRKRMYTHIHNYFNKIKILNTAKIIVCHLHNM
jgi:hypothetical protein